MSTRPLTIQLEDSELADLRVVLEYRRSRRARRANPGPVLPPDANEARLRNAVKAAISFAGHCARESMAAEDRNFEDDDPGDWDPPKWGDTWDLSDLSDDMSEVGRP